MRYFREQDDGILGKAVGKMIYRSVRSRFRNVYWIPPKQPILAPSILVPTHHGWFDGYLMYCAVKQLQLPCIDWIEEFDAFPLFAKIGGLPFPKNDPSKRIQTVRRSIEWMRKTDKNLILFAEGILHEAPQVLALGKSLQTVAKSVPVKSIVPVAIVYKMGLHERPEAFLSFGDPIGTDQLNLERFRANLEALARQTKERTLFDFSTLVLGTGDINERLGFNRNRQKTTGKTPK